MSLLSIKKMIKLDSIRSRYIVGAFFLSILFITSVWFTHISISDVVSRTALNSHERNRLIETHHLIREKIRKTEQILQSYLVSPEKHEYDLVMLQIDESIGYVQQLTETDWVSHNKLLTKSTLLMDELKQFRQAAAQLMDVRTNAEQLFPAYTTINQVMLPQSRQFMSHMEFIIDELSSRLTDHRIHAPYRQFNLIREEWSDMVGAFRMYVAARTMSLSYPVESNLEFESVIETHYLNLRKQLQFMQQQPAGFDLGLLAEGIEREISSILEKWYQGFTKTRSIYSSQHWRQDDALMSQSIQPLNKLIWGHLNDIEISLTSSSDSDVDQLSIVASEVNYILWIRMLVALVFMIIAFYGFERWLLQPVAQIAHALKLEAEGHEVAKLPQANTLETRELVKAFEDMRSEVRIRQRELEHQAMHDSLTSLPNRLFLRRSMIMAIEDANQNNRSLALLMIDLNRFKEINDTLGHHIGDRVLQQIGPRFKRQLDERDVLSRLGGDEFAILLRDADAVRASEMAHKLSKCLDEDLDLSEQALHVGCSIGIALYPQHGLNEQSLLQRADVAMYQAKQKNIRYAVYDEDKDDHSVWQLSLEGELKHAIEERQLELYYQPKIDLVSNRVSGVEALLRWNHPVHGLIPADEIHLLAEKTGLIKPLTKWVLETVVEQLAHWHSADIDLYISANLSVWNLEDPRLLDCVTKELRKWNVPANKLTLEITESAVMADPAHALKTLSLLAILGIRLSIDDFGIGFSSLQYLKKLPVAEIKIDKSFVMDMIIDENDAVIVRSTIALAHNLGLTVTAEGVESQEIYDLLHILGSDEAQGYHMAQAMSVQDLEQWLQESRWGLNYSVPLKLIKT